jgi:hypothetical protein
MTSTSAYSMQGVIAYYPELVRPVESYIDARTIIECLGGTTTHYADRATHELALQHTPRKGLPLITQDVLDYHLQGATDALFAATPPSLTAYAPVFDSSARKRSLWSRLSGARIESSQYFGDPWMPKGEPWPEFDGRPMNFVLQMDLSMLPVATSLPRLGLLTLFKAENQAPEQGDSFITIYDPTRRGSVRSAPSGVDSLPPAYVSGWLPMEDRPDREDLRASAQMPFVDLLSFVSSNTRGKFQTLDGDEISEAIAIQRRAESHYQNFQCDKLAGWPNWMLTPNWQVDSQGNPMEFVYQVGAELGMVLGDAVVTESEHPVAGRGHIFYSSHTDEVSFVWDC